MELFNLYSFYDDKSARSCFKEECVSYLLAITIASYTIIVSIPGAAATGIELKLSLFAAGHLCTGLAAVAAPGCHSRDLSGNSRRNRYSCRSWSCCRSAGGSIGRQTSRAGFCRRCIENLNVVSLNSRTNGIIRGHSQ